MYQLMVLVLLVAATTALPPPCDDSSNKHQVRVPLEICFNSKEEESICTDLKNSNHGKPAVQFVCSPYSSFYNLSGECFGFFKVNFHDVISPKPAIAYSSIGKYHFQPLLKQYENSTKTVGVAIVKKSSTIRSWSHFNFSKACQTPKTGRPGEWLMSALDSILIDILGNNKCPFFDRFRQSLNFQEQDGPNALECLASGKGDVAFIDYDSAKKAIDDGKFKPADFELLCKEGGRRPFDQYTSCNLGAALPTILNNPNLSEKKINEIISSLIIGKRYYQKHMTIFDAMCFYQNNGNVLPVQTAKGDFMNTSSFLSYLKKN